MGSVRFILLCFTLLPLMLGASVLKNDSLKLKKPKPEYVLTLVKGVNTNEADFGAIPYQGNILYVSGQPKDLVNQQSTDVNGIPYTDVLVFATDSGKVKTPLFLKKVNGEFHDGPMAFANNETEIYLTRVDYQNKKTKKYINKAKLMVFVKNGNSWAASSSFKYNNDSYSVGHASVSNDARFLFFASDMPGGFGGKDLYVCEKEGNEWGVPKNLGKEINTAGDEEFPYIKKDGVLFFSSNGHKGFGGFDIYSANAIAGNWYLKRNEGAGLNTEADDFGIVFADETHGYVASNRSGGFGKEDIYSFVYTPAGTDFLATLLLTANAGNPAIRTPVYLLNARGKKIDSTITAANGFFRFNNLEKESSYMVAVEPDDIEYVGKARFYVANAIGEVIGATKKTGAGNYVFEQLPTAGANSAGLYLPGDLTLSGCLSYNRNGTTVYIEKAEVTIINSFGDVTDTTQTNKLGSFVFKNLLSGQEYVLSIRDSLLNLPEGTVVTLSDRHGRHLKTFIAGKDVFKYRLLPADNSVLSALSTNEELGDDFKGLKKRSALNAKLYQKIYLMDENKRVIDSVYTSGKGFFKFKNIGTEETYMAYFEEDDLKLLSKNRSYYLVDEKGKVLTTAQFFEKNKFAFNNLIADSMGLAYTSDENLNLAGSLRYGAGKGIALKNVLVKLTDENAVVIDSALTNGAGCFLFRNLPQGKNYLITVDKKTLNVPNGTKISLTDKNGKLVKTFYANGTNFQYKVLGVEKNGITALQTSEDELVVKLKGVVKNISKQALQIDSVILINKAGKTIERVSGNTDGHFEFNYAKLGDLKAIELLIKNTKDSVIYLTNEKGQVVASIKRAEGGSFHYQLLDADKYFLGEFSIDDPWLKVGNIKKDAEPLVISENLFYEVNSFKVDSAGRMLLDKVVQILKTNPKVNIELSSYTDSRADDAFNLKLSNKRAQYAVNYMISKGISKARLKATGYGESKPLNGCINGVNCSEKDHALNRRTEFKIINTQ